CWSLKWIHTKIGPIIVFALLNYNSMRSTVMSGLFLQRSGHTPACREILLARIQLDDELFVHDGLHLFARRDARHLPAERVAIDREPVGDGSDLSEIEVAQH